MEPTVDGFLKDGGHSGSMLGGDSGLAGLMGGRTHLRRADDKKKKHDMSKVGGLLTSEGSTGLTGLTAPQVRNLNAHSTTNGAAGAGMADKLLDGLLDDTSPFSHGRDTPVSNGPGAFAMNTRHPLHSRDSVNSGGLPAWAGLDSDKPFLVDSNSLNGGGEANEGLSHAHDGPHTPLGVHNLRHDHHRNNPVHHPNRAVPM
eukprot:GFYU01016366.1.p1 GENE.GFYU01016366.1~~GFYU01016366.1.p1  ORF type:complete len:216 (-),score=50.60 GFYU01016366.1:102-704(-)